MAVGAAGMVRDAVPRGVARRGGRPDERDAVEAGAAGRRIRRDVDNGRLARRRLVLGLRRGVRLRVPPLRRRGRPRGTTFARDPETLAVLSSLAAVLLGASWRPLPAAARPVPRLAAASALEPAQRPSPAVLAEGAGHNDAADLRAATAAPEAAWVVLWTACGGAAAAWAWRAEARADRENKAAPR